MLGALSIGCSPATLSSDPGPPSPVVEYVQKQEILTPLPLRVRLPAAWGAEHVVVLYRPWGTQGWHELELGREGQTWSGEVSCREVSTVTGDTKYFFVALDPQGEVVAGSGSPDWPHVATIVGALPDGAQSLAGAAAPTRCHDVADCPPDFPGCPAYSVRRHACRSNDDCGDGVSCAWDGYCGSPSGGLASEIIAPTPHDASDEEQLDAAVKAVKKKYRNTAAATPKRATR